MTFEDENKLIDIVFELEQIKALLESLIYEVEDSTRTLELIDAKTKLDDCIDDLDEMKS